MAENSNIEWTDHTFNPWRGCTKVSPACENCYAETMSKRNPGVLGVWGKYGTRVIASETMWQQPLTWNRKAEAEGVRRKVFCASLADVFEGNDTLPDNTYHAIRAARIRLFQLIDATPNLDWLLLTKRPHLVQPILDDISHGNGDAWSLKNMPNVWLGTTVENQEWADKRIPELIKVPAAVRFLSVEPMLGPVDIDVAQHLDNLNRGREIIDWVICGGESGSKARPMQPDWARSLRDQCNVAGVPFFFKQWGEHAPNWLNDDNGKIPGSEWIDRMGKKMAGRLLDGRTWDEMPEVVR